METFRKALERFVREPARGSKSEAARLLGITRAEVHAYLGKREPRRDKLARLSRAIGAPAIPERAVPPSEPAGRAAAVSDEPALDTPALAIQLIRYLYDLLEDAHARSRR